jgi:hypothetical protein
MGPRKIVGRKNKERWQEICICVCIYIYAYIQRLDKIMETLQTLYKFINIYIYTHTIEYEKEWERMVRKLKSEVENTLR